MSQRLAAKAAPLLDKKSANIGKFIGLSNSCVHLKSIKNIFRNILPEEILPVSLQNEKTKVHLSGTYKRFLLPSDKWFGNKK